MDNKKITKNGATQNQKLTWKTVDQVFKKASKKPVFQRAYHIESERIRIARALREARLKKNLTQATVAKRVRMPQSVIARLESGSHSTSIDTLSKVANALGKKIQLV